MLKLFPLAVLPGLLAFLTHARAPGGGEACRAAEQAAQQRHWSHEDFEHEIFFAVFEGLYLDGVSNEAVDAIIARDPDHGYTANFVWGCPICMPAYEAFRAYRARPRFESKKTGGDTFGPGLDPAVLASMTAGDVPSRQKAIMDLVQRWLARRLEAMRLTEPEREEWRVAMAERRKKGNAILEGLRESNPKGSYTQMKSCPFCDAANGAL